MAKGIAEGIEGRRALVRRFYEDVWNQWDEATARTILTPTFEFRGSLARSTHGIDPFLDYVSRVRRAFPDFHNEVLELVADGEEPTLAVRLVYTGTHEGELFGHAASGHRIEYAGAAFFRCSGSRIASAWVLGDLQGLLEQLV